MSETFDLQKREARLQRRRQRESQCYAQEAAEQREIRLNRQGQRDRARRQQQRAKTLKSSLQLRQERLQRAAYTLYSGRPHVSARGRQFQCA